MRAPLRGWLDWVARTLRDTVLDEMERPVPGPFIIFLNWFQQPHSEVKQE